MLSEPDDDLKAHYNTVFLPNTVTLDNIDLLLQQHPITPANSLSILASSCTALKADFNNYLLDSYQTLEFTKERLLYVDIGNMARFVVRQFKHQQTDCFNPIFSTAEQLLLKGDIETQNLIIIGFLEDIQNLAGNYGMNYHHGFDQWLRPHSKKAWQELIDLWENKK